jgi:hypothetical protein
VGGAGASRSVTEASGCRLSPLPPLSPPPMRPTVAAAAAAAAAAVVVAAAAVTLGQVGTVGILEPSIQAVTFTGQSESRPSLLPAMSGCQAGRANRNFTARVTDGVTARVTAGHPHHWKCRRRCAAARPAGPGQQPAGVTGRSTVTARVTAGHRRGPASGAGPGPMMAP